MAAHEPTKGNTHLIRQKRFSFDINPSTILFNNKNTKA